MQRTGWGDQRGALCTGFTLIPIILLNSWEKITKHQEVGKTKTGKKTLSIAMFSIHLF